jgi:hypothetical protein
MVCEQDRESAIRAELTVNGQHIDLNSFVQDFVGGAVIGMVSSLRDVNDIQTLMLNISKKK